MMTHTDFSAEKQRLLAELRTLDQQLASAETATEVDLSDLRQKLAHALSSVGRERFSIAMFGAFSDGKTTVTGALLNRSDLRIASAPTTDQITELPTGDYVIVDTPGLFSDGMLHDERTRKYISEANLILFVLPPQNPLKESHREIVAWLLNELGKLPSTVFVVNKMDEVADVEDDEEFQESAGVRREVVTETLSRYLGKCLPATVICIAADPRQKGLSYWFEHPDEYERLSRIGELRQVMDRTVRETRRALILRAGFDVMREAQSSSLSRIREALRAVEEQLNLTGNAREEISQDIEELEEESRRAWDGLMKEFENERKRLVLGIDAQSSAAKLATYVMAEIGKDGDELLRRVDRMITNHAEPLAGNARRKMERIDAAVEFQAASQKRMFDVIGKVSGGLAKWLAQQSGRGLANAILSMNRAWKITKFKPWGAVKLAGKLKVLGKFLAILGPVLDVLGPAMEIWNERKIREQKTQLTTAIDELFREVRDHVPLGEMRSACCPGLDEARSLRAELGKEQGDYRTVREKLMVAKSALEQCKLSDV